MTTYTFLRNSIKKKIKMSNDNYNKVAKPTILGLNPKQLSLSILIIQNSMQVLMMRYSLTSQTTDIYIASTAVFMAELFKISTCLYMLYLHEGSRFQKTIRVDIFQKPQELALMLVPSGLYALQNNLLYIALSNLEAATFQVTYQLKIFTTALFSVWLLGRSLNRIKWLSLCLLMTGVTCVQLESASNNKLDNDQRPWIGLVAVLASCISSGFAGCYFEKLLKTSTTSMWVRNIQLSLCGAVFSFWGMMVSDYSVIRSLGFFHGYNALTWCVVTNQALGGLLVSLVVKYADNILKGFASSISIILSGMISFCLFDFKPSFLFVLGTAIVMVATVLYSSNIRL